MSWRISQKYGYGAACVELAAEPHFVAHHSLRLWGAMRDAGRDFYLTCVPPLVLALFMLTALFVTVSKDRGYTDLEVVMISNEPIELADETPEPEPVEKPPEPVVQKKAEPPPVQQLARQAPKPPPPARPRPEPQRPKPPPRPVARPVVKPEIDALALQPPPRSAAPAPARRGNRVREQVMPKPAPKPALAPLAKPELAKEADAGRSRRFAAVRASMPTARPRADLGPPIAARSLDAPAPAAPPPRTRRPAPTGERERHVAKVSFAGPAAPTAPSATRTAPGRHARTAPSPAPDHRAPPPPMDIAAAAPAAPRMDLPGAPRRTVERRERNTAPRSRSDHTGSGALAGVPLASLKACVSESEEEALKRKLVAAVTTQGECVSRAGTYRFVETKNLNAFLMTIQRAPGRPVADRCVELRHALECVSR